MFFFLQSTFFIHFPPAHSFLFFFLLVYITSKKERKKLKVSLALVQTLHKHTNSLMCLDLSGGHCSKHSHCVLTSFSPSEMGRCAPTSFIRIRFPMIKILTFDENVIVQFSLQLKKQSARKSMWLSRQPPSDSPDGLQQLSFHL